ncbi:MAG: hypothetical protein A2787_02030 [Omnitrophica WOR_2 bacterium RIFCSPHIGHO2_01_FULL_48_9]|nr:MAG: hypothetical protein A3D10_01750 [Omnitrophica WOR_2 bacterium RIFCSPHIGHO2_02_FULL_48_11]OGX34398.1 MAG: hypothetical protein A2787_02030 [Omnitrophica WOR_2 bacterium RIFCSPHIGHO2_01_FULL_48_9]
MTQAPVFTTILDTYYRPALLKEAVNALLRQTYEKQEIILVSNGGTPETVEYLREVEAKDKRVKLIYFKENQYSVDDPQKMLDVCLNAGLKIATGDYIWYQADDDMIADDYAEKMVRLFEGNPECLTAAGSSLSIDINGQIMTSAPKIYNERPRYSEGHIVALDHLRGGRMFNAPGTILTVKREALIKFGGFHRAIDLSQTFGIMPFGITGFDETAILYWRRHEGQLNKQLTINGWIGTNELLSFLKEWDVKCRWQIFGADVAQEIVTTLVRKKFMSAAEWFVNNLYSFHFFGAFRLFCDSWNRPYFWKNLPRSFWTERSCLKASVKKLFKNFSRLKLSSESA